MSNLSSSRSAATAVVASQPTADGKWSFDARAGTCNELSTAESVIGWSTRGQQRCDNLFGANRAPTFKEIPCTSTYMFMHAFVNT
jgi:hypothetical protein